MAFMWLLEKLRQKISYFSKMDESPFALAKEVFASNFEKTKKKKNQKPPNLFSVFIVFGEVARALSVCLFCVWFVGCK